jgi:hypothetical protein
MDQTRTNRILFDIPADALELFMIPDQMIVAFFLPERRSSKVQHLVGKLRGESFESLGQNGQRNEGAYEHVDVVRHDRERVQVITLQNVRIMADDLDHHVCDSGLPKVDRTRASFIQQAIERSKRLSGGDRGFRKRSIGRQTAVETPRQEDRVIGVIEVWKASAVEGHEDLVSSRCLTSPDQPAGRPAADQEVRPTFEGWWRIGARAE